MAKGTRTLDDRNHNPGLYQLSYAHHQTFVAGLFIPANQLARPAGLEPATLGLEGRCSIQMSYGRILIWKTRSTSWPNHGVYGRGRGIRTPDTLVPNQVRYQTALYPDTNSQQPRSRSGSIAVGQLRCSAAGLYAPEKSRSMTAPSLFRPRRLGACRGA